MTGRDALHDLRDNPHFRDFAEQKMAENGDFWLHESREGSGFMRDVAEAIVAVGGDGQDIGKERVSRQNNTIPHTRKVIE